MLSLERWYREADAEAAYRRALEEVKRGGDTQAVHSLYQIARRTGKLEEMAKEAPAEYLSIANDYHEDPAYVLQIFDAMEAAPPLRVRQWAHRDLRTDLRDKVLPTFVFTTRAEFWRFGVQEDPTYSEYVKFEELEDREDPFYILEQPSFEQRKNMVEFYQLMREHDFSTSGPVGGRWEYEAWLHGHWYIGTRWESIRLTTAMHRMYVPGFNYVKAEEGVLLVNSWGGLG